MYPATMEQYDKQVLEKLYKNRRITESDCWEWTRDCFKDGYGKTTYKNSTWRVHRLILLLLKPDVYYKNSCILHICDNRKCFNPEHLKGGTNWENTSDMIAKGRNANLAKTHCPSGHEYSAENTFHNKDGSRGCRECRKRYLREYQQQHTDWRISHAKKETKT